MKEKEIEQELLNGKSLTIKFLTRTNWFSIGEQGITEKQFDKIRDKYKDRLDFKADYSGMTRHYYTLNK